MRTTLVLLLACAVLTCRAHQIHWDIIDLLSSKPPKEQFKLWHYFFQKSYDINSQEGELRYSNFLKNSERIKEFNERKLSYSLGLGMFSDEDFEVDVDLKIEDSNINLSLEGNDYFDRIADFEDNQENQQEIVQDSKDWSYLYEKNYPEIDRKYNKNLYCEVHAQAKAFAYTITGHQWIDSPKEDAVSDQYLRNCIQEKEDCRSVPALANYVKLIQENGIPLAKDLKWENEKGECKMPSKSVKIEVNFTFCMRYWFNQECSNKLIDSYLETGPYVSQISTDFYSMHYKVGIFNPEKCNGSSLAVIVVHKTKDYIKALLPFGKTYGEEGYIRVVNEMGPPHPEQSCGLKSYAFIPNDISKNDS